MARKKNSPRTSRPVFVDEDQRYALQSAWAVSDDEAEIRFSLTALGEAVVSERDRRTPRFRGFGPCGRVVA